MRISDALRRVADDARPPIAHTTRPESYFDSDKRLLQPILSDLLSAEGGLIAIERNAVRSRVGPHMSHACGSPDAGRALTQADTTLCVCGADPDAAVSWPS
jgi:hypothetical protein